MSSRTPRKIACIAMLALAAPFAVAQTGTNMNRVDITGQALAPITHFDVHATCQNIDTQLQDRLGVLMEREGVTGDMRVDFELAGDQIVSVHSHGSTAIMRRSVNRAVGALACTNSGQQQHYAFVLSMRESTDEEIAAGAPRIVASVEDTTRR